MKQIAYADLETLVGVDQYSHWISVEQERINLFADATDDHQWIHTDIARANRELGTTIAHGFLTLSLLSTLLAQTLSIGGLAQSLNYGLNKVRFLRAVPRGARLRLRDRISAVLERSGGKLVTHSCEIEVESVEGPALIAEWMTLHQPETH
jgi:acyl dehydratase